ncbi:MAG: hypothetical protein A2315_12700 [Ignavibacteria bacterium RIFOXYB2_FULL_35_12]|nr:MAG: hypothetical protein A2058_08835 [Ignavibacteria bacterium GWA2_36_19]OGU49430.1 MAG: hypothetical protein A2006_12570 [Ignavibacteria bacterium GWC2_35_8]OGU57410.1 MAG: hypothetical protein A2X60_16625 [Ignavibacteria bacterium GWF2_35_20]OGU79008.1 MAG: hypothetical protein A2254_01595 [Ignavibacteria bacterium RIFOXYA2_FULL_35_9]OGU88347.1 MAG: hypothetical protein A2492_08660 [Ignavibacteria bacterium RIFOXYC12_FULL_35_11]OGU91582.1 MAG: hypothetical protein A3K31_02710 [Ignavibac
MGDIDNNGKVDIVTTMPTVFSVANPNPPRLWVFEWNGVVGENKYGNYTSGVLEPTNSWNFDLPNNVDFRPYGLTIEDIDNDGENELITGVRQSTRGREVIVASVAGELSGFGSWVIEYNFIRTAGGSLYNVTTGDLDNDGNREIYALIWNLFTLYIIECTGPNQYEVVDSLKQVYSAQGIDYGALDGVRVTDVNNDGVNELYIAGTESENTLFIITNITDVSKITASDVKEFYHIPVKGNQNSDGVGKFRSMYVADPDDDGKLDLMIAGERNGQIFDFEYSGQGLPSDSTSWNNYVAFDVWDYSGIPPDAPTSLHPRFFYGSPTCPQGPIDEFNLPLCDMDQDGLAEYVFVNYSSSFEVWQNDAYVWVLEAQPQTGIEDELINSPNGFVLKQNYPNPFNPSTSIQYALNSAQFVTLKVYDALGTEIATLVNEEKAAGVYQVEFNPASGVQHPVSSVYFYRLQAGSFSETKKMILMK